jgi:hypothetical protein
MVRRDMIDNTVGYRGGSISELWTGPSKLKPEHKKLLRKIFTIIDDANRRLTIWPLIETGEFGTIAEGMAELDESLIKAELGRSVDRDGTEDPAEAGHGWSLDASASGQRQDQYDADDARGVTSPACERP